MQDTQPVLTEDEQRLLALETRMEELRTERDSVIGELKETTRQRDQLYATVEAQRAIKDMTDAQRAALTQVLGAEGIQSTNQFGEPN